MTNIVLGYLLSFLYMIAVIAIGELISKKFNTDKEMTRKVEHLATSASFALCYIFVGETIHLVIINFFAMVALAAITFTGFMSSVERDDAAKSYGLFYFGISTFVNIAVAVFVDIALVPYAAIAYYSLALGDGLAPIIAKAFSRFNTALLAPKTLVGSLTVFLVSSLAALTCNFIFDLGLSALMILSLGSLAAHTELYGKKDFDNITLPLSVFGYLMLWHYELVPVSMQIALIVLMLYTTLCIKAGALTFAGCAVSFVYLMASAFFGSASVIAMILILFFAEAIVSRLSSKLYRRKNPEKKKEKHARSGIQILANTTVSLVTVIIYYFTKNPLFLITSLAVVAEEFADSIASAIGSLSKRQPLDVLRFRRVESGISGGVSLIGLIGALLASFAAMSIPLLFGEITPKHFVISSVIVFVGTLIDSILGSLIQALYRCPSCSSLTESGRHCDTDATLIKGIRIIDNSTVNFLSSALTALICAIAFIFIR